MDDIDRVFARFKDDKPEPADRRETLSIPRRNGAGGSRTVDVVHVRSGRRTTDRPQRLDPGVRAASWDGGFQAKRAIATPVLPVPVSVPVIAPTTHVMPAWEPSAEVADAAPDEPLTASRHGRGRPRKHPTQEPATAVAEEQIPSSGQGHGRPRKVIANAQA